LSPDAPESGPAPRLDVGRILESLDRHGVSYLIVGGIAATIHGATRQTTDFDCLPARTPVNLRRLAAALNELGARLRVSGMTDQESKALGVVIDDVMLGRAQQTTWRTDAGDLDVLTEIAHRNGRIGFDELALRSVSLKLDDIDVRLISLDDLIASKEAADRDKDHEALPELRELRDDD
jgi:hypothetical protein